MSPAAWTWMIYIATHNDVARFGEASIQRMRQATLDSNVRVLVQQDTAQHSSRLEIGTSPELVVELDSATDSGDPQTLLDFITWAAEHAPARCYALVLWSHGSGWEPGEMARIAQNAPAAVPVSTAELKQRDDDERRQVFFASTVRQLLAAPTPNERAIAADNGSGHSIDCVELGQVIAQAAQRIGQPIDLLAMNACQMASAEVVYQCRDHVITYVASEEDMPAQSLPYDDILNRLVAEPALESAALAQLIVERYCDFYQNNHNLPWGQGKFPAGVTLAAINPAACTQLSAATKQLAALLKDAIENEAEAVWTAHRAAMPFKFRLYDLANFCQTLAAQPDTVPAIAQAAQQVAALFDPGALVLARGFTAAKYAGAGGLTAYLMPPTPGQPLSPYYAETAFARDTGWGDFLAAYHAAVT